jgi:hypothetical protein
MGLLKLVVKSPDGTALAGAQLTLSAIDGGAAAGPVATDPAGCARFKVEQGRYAVSAVGLPAGQVLPNYPSVVELYPNTEAAEFVLELTKGSIASPPATPSTTTEVDVDDDPKLPAY